MDGEKEASKQDLWRLLRQLEYFSDDATPDRAAKLMYQAQIRNFKEKFYWPTDEEIILMEN